LKEISILASGTGTNARRILEYFEHHPSVRVSLIISNKKDAPVRQVAAEFGVRDVYLDRERFYDGITLPALLNHHRIDLVVLAGFLWKVPGELVRDYSGRMINLHPALLPKFGGKGMYGKHVHRAVKEADERESGITIHWVNENYDEGAVIFQARCRLEPDDEAGDIARKVQALEHEHFAPLIERLLIGP